MRSSSGFGMCFRCNDGLGEGGVSKKFKVFAQQVHVLTPGKALWFVAWRHEAPITWRSSWRPPYLLREDLFCIDSFYTRAISICKKSVRLPIKGGRPTLVKGIGFWEIHCWERVLGPLLLYSSEFWFSSLLFPFIVREGSFATPQQKVHTILRCQGVNCVFTSSPIRL
jgi:hypothetical protein